MQKAAIFGAAGAIGQAIASELERRGLSIAIMPRDTYFMKPLVSAIVAALPRSAAAFTIEPMTAPVKSAFALACKTPAASGGDHVAMIADAQSLLKQEIASGAAKADTVEVVVCPICGCRGRTSERPLPPCPDPTSPSPDATFAPPLKIAARSPASGKSTSISPPMPAVASVNSPNKISVARWPWFSTRLSRPLRSSRVKSKIPA
jgi:hypothetical protein